jgi:outer membrane protein assembly factor BamB
VGTADGTVYCITPDATVKWTYRIPDRVVTAPAISSTGAVLVGCRNGRLYCLRDGRLEWEFDTGQQRSMMSGALIDVDGRVYFAVHNSGTVYALDVRTGKDLWKLGVPVYNEAISRVDVSESVNVHLSLAVDAQGNLYVVTAEGGVYCIADRTVHLADKGAAQ